MSCITKTLGKGFSNRAIITSVTLAAIILFYPLSLGSYFSPDVYEFKERTTYHQFFKNEYIFTWLGDSLVILLSLFIWAFYSLKHAYRWMVIFPVTVSFMLAIVFLNEHILQILSIISLPLVISLYIMNKVFHRFDLIHLDAGKLCLSYLAISFSILAVISIYSSAVNIDYDPFMDIITLFSRYSHVILFMVIFSVIFRIVFRICIELGPGSISTALDFIKPIQIPSYEINRKSAVIVLSIFMALSAFIVLIPHLDGQHQTVAVDTSLYEAWVSPMEQLTDLRQFLWAAFVELPPGSEGDRPLSLLLLYTISSLSDPIFGFEIFLPAVLAPALVFILYYLTKELTGSILVSLFAALITVVSFQIMIGIYAGFYANWIALIFGYTSLIFSIRFLNTGSRKNLIWLSLSMVALLISHVYTWTIFTTFLIIFLMVLKFQRLYDFKAIKFVLAIAICLVFLDLSKSYLVDLTSGIQHNLGIAENTGFGLSDRWSTMVRTVQVHLGGIFGNIIILALALYPAIFLSYRNVAGIFILLFLSIGILPLFFGDLIVQSRVLYDIPFQIPAALTISALFTKTNGRLLSGSIIISLMAISIHTMDNLGIFLQ